VTAAALDNTGKIYLTGSSADQALLDIAGSAGFGTAGVLSGYARLAGDSAIEFQSGEITSLGADAHLGLVGNEAFTEDSTATGSNSALTGLASIGADALFALHDGAAVSTTGAQVNDGNVYLDPNSGDGGSSLTVGGTLTNTHELGIGNTTLSASDEVTVASLDNTGFIQLTGSVANQALLDLTGSAGSSIGAGATLDLENNGAVSTFGSLVNDGRIRLDANAGDRGGSSLTVAGALTNSDGLIIGNPSLSVPDKVTAASLVDAGYISLTGSFLDVTTGVAGFGTAGVLSGNVGLYGDSAIEFASGQITSVTNDQGLVLDGNDAFVEDSTALGKNSALTGLASIGAGAQLELENKASVSTTQGRVLNR
jgi:hypothetical protein